MKVLLDHNLKPKLRRLLAGHQVMTARDMKWDRLENGDLLTAAEREGFEVMLTGDQGIQYQQNNRLRKIALVVLSNTDWAIVRHEIDRIAEAILRTTPGSFELLPIPQRAFEANKTTE